MNAHTLVVDAGSTKTSWTVITPELNTVPEEITRGINPLLMSPTAITDIIKTLSPVTRRTPFSKIMWYGAGCIDDVTRSTIADCLKQTLECDDVEVGTDMLCAARSLCGHRPGIACIIGTGSNSCLFDGNVIVDNVPPLGFILGDEGSGAWLGRNLLSDAAKRMLPEDLHTAFINEFSEPLPEKLHKVYRGEAPSGYLASLAPFIARHIAHPWAQKLVTRGFTTFLERNVAHYEGSRTLPLYFAGSIAANFSRQLREVSLATGYHLRNIQANPSAGIVKYHIDELK